jgi:hypothetical protein
MGRFHVGLEETPISEAKAGSKAARAFFQISVVPDLSSRTQTLIGSGGSLPVALRPCAHVGRRLEGGGAEGACEASRRSGSAAVGEDALG